MIDLFASLDCWQQQNEEIALATLVAVRGSAPRLPGARLVLTRSGRMAGSVTGGCVENDVFERALQVLERGQAVLASYGLAEKSPLGVGLSCGSVDVLIEPFVDDPAWQTVRDAVESHRPAALATALGPAPLLGRKLAIGADGKTVGAIAPEIDARVAMEARRLLNAGGTDTIRLPCGSGEEAIVFVQAFVAPARLHVIGATHIAIALSQMAKRLGFRVSVVDARGLYATVERFREADEVVRAAPAEALAAAGLDASSYVVVLTHDFKFDVPALACALRSPAPYIGVLGSRATHARRRELLLEQGFTDGDLARLRAPIGLDLGARTPEEIALSILAEMVAVRNGASGQPLCQRSGPIRPRG